MIDTQTIRDPVLLAGRVLTRAKEQAGLSVADYRHAVLRVYPSGERGHYFLRAAHPKRWYWQQEPTDTYFTRADTQEVLAAAADGARVHLTGSHSRPLNGWENWSEFEAWLEGGGGCE